MFRDAFPLIIPSSPFRIHHLFLLLSCQGVPRTVPPLSDTSSVDASSSSGTDFIGTSEPTPHSVSKLIPNLGEPVWAFRDATTESDIDFVVALESPELIAGGVGLFDADGDGDVDVLITSDASDSAFFRNQGDATFVDDTKTVGLQDLRGARGVAIADYDNDSDPDIYVCGNGPARLYRNDAGVFVETAAALGLTNRALSYSAAWCDFDNDGDLDLYVGNYLITLQGRDSPYFRGDPNRLYRNDGGGFVDVAPALGVDSTGATLAVTCTDYDDDGDADLYEVNDYGMFNLPNRLWRNQGTHFVDVAADVGVAAQIFGMGAVASDYDNDGDLDLYASNFASNLLHQNNGGVFVDVASDAGASMMGFSDPDQEFPGYPPINEDEKDAWLSPLEPFVQTYCDRSSTDLLLTHWSALFFDYDQDGWQDLYVANGFVAIAPTLPEGRSQPNRLLRNMGGTFVDRSRSSRTNIQGDDRVASAGDLDADGDLDLVVAGAGLLDESTRKAHVLLNEGLTGHWLTIRPVGVLSNRDSIGARVIVRAQGLEQMREISGGYGFASTAPKEAHFGLGDASTADEVEIRWPSGVARLLLDVAADQKLEVLEEE